jgi:chromosome segregation ATPase
MRRKDKRILVEPEEILFHKIDVGKVYLQEITLTNSLSAFVDLEITVASSPDRLYEIIPNTLKLQAGDSSIIELRLRATKPIARTPAKDILYIKSELFTEKVYIELRPGEHHRSVSGNQDKTTRWQPDVEEERSILIRQLEDKSRQLEDAFAKIAKLEEELEEVTGELHVAQENIEEKNTMEHQLARFHEENIELKAEIEEHKKQGEYIEKVKGILRQTAPSLETLMELSLKQERDKNERRNANVLAILQRKEQLIEDLETRLEEQDRAATQLTHKLNDYKVLISNNQKSIQIQQQTIEELKQTNYQKEKEIERIQKELDSVVEKMQKSDPTSYTRCEDISYKGFDIDREIDSLRNKVLTLSEELKKSNGEVAKLRQREEYVLELSNRQNSSRHEYENSIRERDRIIAELKGKIQTQAEHIENLLGQFSQMNTTELLQKMLKLEEENKMLQSQMSYFRQTPSSGSLKQEELIGLSFSNPKKLKELESLSQSFKLKKQKLKETIEEKTKEIQEMQAKMYDLQLAAQRSSDLSSQIDSKKSREIEKLTQTLRSESEKSRHFEQENSELKQIVESLEKANKDLTRDMTTIAQKLDSGDVVAQSMATQTQLVSRLNARISSLKVREEKALSVAAEAEQRLGQMRQQFEDERRNWGKEKMSEGPKVFKVDVRSINTQTEELEDDGDILSRWETFEKRRVEKKVAQLNKEATMYQMRHYEVLKENNDLKESITHKLHQQTDEITNLQRELLIFQRKYEGLQDEFRELTIKNHAAKKQTYDLEAQKVELQAKHEVFAKEQAEGIEKLHNTIKEMQFKLTENEITLQERNTQITVLMENIEHSSDVNQKIADLTAQLCSSKAVEANLNRRVSDLTTLLQEHQKKLREVSLRLNTLTDENTSYKHSYNDALFHKDKLIKEKSEIQHELTLKNHDLKNLTAQIDKLNGEKQDLKTNQAKYLQQLSESQKRHAQVLAKERQEFRDNLLKIREEFTVPLDSDPERPLILAINQLNLQLNSLKPRCADPEVFEKIIAHMQKVISECDKSLLASEGKCRELEFMWNCEVYYRYLDPNVLEKNNQLLDEYEMLVHELKLLKKPQSAGMDAVLKERITELEATLKGKNEEISKLEQAVHDLNIRNLETQRNLSWARDKIAALEVDAISFEKNCMFKAEDELRKKLKLRDEEIKGYLDSQLVKHAMDCSEANKILNLGREICSYKIIVSDLERRLENAMHEKSAIELSYESLKAILDDYEHKPVEVNVIQFTNNELRWQLDDKTSQFNQLKQELEKLKLQHFELEKANADLRLENSSLSHYRAEATAPVSTREQELRKEITELKEKQRVEIENVKTECELKMQNYKEKLDSEYIEQCEKFQDGEFPGDYRMKFKRAMQDYEMLQKHYTELEIRNAEIENQLASSMVNERRLKEDAETYKQIIAEIQSGLFTDASPEVSKAPSAPQTGKKSRKPSLSFERSARKTQPQKLIKALISAKIGEAEACRKLRTSARQQIELHEGVVRSQERQKELEARCRILERQLRLHDIPEPTSFQSPDSEECSIVHLKKRLLEVERENDELRLREANAWIQATPLSYQFLERNEGSYQDQDFGTLIEGIVYLTEQLSEIDRDSFTSISSDLKRPVDIEQCQRLVIRALSRAISKYFKGDEGLSSIVTYKPSREEDRQLWYVELLETQLEVLHNTIRDLVEFTQQLSVEISGSLTANASYKGASIELAKNTKETADELDLLKHMCMLIRDDLHNLRSDERVSGEDAEHIYRERAMLAEGMKRKLEEELLQVKLKHSYELSDITTQLNSFTEENKQLRNKLIDLESTYKDRSNKYEEQVNRKQRLEEQVNLLEKRNNELEDRIAEMKRSSESTGYEKKKLESELKYWQHEKNQTLNSKDLLVSELQKQNKTLQEERSKLAQENAALKKQNRDFRTVTEDSTKKEELEIEVTDLKRRLQTLTDDWKYEQTKFRREKEAADNKINQLEECVSYYKTQKPPKPKAKKCSRSHSTGRPPRQKKGADEMDLELEEHTKAIEMMNLKNEFEIQLIQLNSQLGQTQAQLREKLEKLDEEVRKRLEAENKLKSLESQNTLSHNPLVAALEEARKDKERCMMEIQRLNSDIDNLKEEKDRLMNRFDERVDKADSLAKFIKESDQERKAIEQQLRTEISNLNKQIQSDSAQMKSLLQRCQELESALETARNEREGLTMRNRQLEDLWQHEAPKLGEYQQKIRDNSQKLKQYESDIQDLLNVKDSLEEEYNSKLEEIMQNMKNQFEEYERTVEMYEGQINSFKELYLNDIKARKGIKKATESIDFWMQISKKDSLIKSLRGELKTLQAKKAAKKPKSSIQGVENPEQIVTLQSQVYNLKGKIRNLEAQTLNLKEQNNKLLEELDAATQTQEEKKDKDTLSKREVSDLERRYRQEVNKLSTEIQSMKDKWHSPEEWASLTNSYRELEAAYKKSLDEVNRKRELLDNYKALREQQESENVAIQDEIEQVKDISEKMRRLKAELSRKDKTISELKMGLDTCKEVERKLGEENNVLNDKVKASKNDLARKDVIIKELKAKIDSYLAEFENSKNMTEQNEKLREQIRKLKIDCERKDAQVKALKTNIDTMKLELESRTVEHTQAATENFSSLEKEIKKNEKLQIQLKKTEQQLQNLYLITRRIFRELGSSVESLRTKFRSSAPLDREYYSDCMNILNISMDELNEFVSPKSQTDSLGASLEHLDRMLEQKDVDVSEVLDIFNRLIDERIELERSDPKVGEKYENYIKKMKQEVSHQRRAYEEKIKELEYSLRRQS